jgi:hypothetical protein
LHLLVYLLEYVDFVFAKFVGRTTFKTSWPSNHLKISVLQTTLHAQFLDIFVIYEHANFMFFDKEKKKKYIKYFIALEPDVTEKKVYVINYYIIAKQFRIY